MFICPPPSSLDAHDSGCGRAVFMAIIADWPSIQYESAPYVTHTVLMLICLYTIISLFISVNNWVWTSSPSIAGINTELLIADLNYVYFLTFISKLCILHILFCGARDFD